MRRRRVRHYDQGMTFGLRPEEPPYRHANAAHSQQNRFHAVLMFHCMKYDCPDDGTDRHVQADRPRLWKEYMQRQRRDGARRNRERYRARKRGAL